MTTFLTSLATHLFCALAFCSASSRVMAGFGETVEQCDAEYGKARVLPADKKLVCPQTRAYIKAGLSYLIGFDEDGHAERFVISKIPVKTTDLSETEQKAQLDAFADGSTWKFHANNGNGPIWDRADGGAYASWNADARYMVLMNKRSMDRHIKQLP